MPLQIFNNTSDQLRVRLLGVQGDGRIASSSINFEQAIVVSESAVSDLAVDVTKLYSSKTISTDATITFVGTPVAGQRFALQIKNTDSLARTVTIPECYSLNSKTKANHSVTVPAQLVDSPGRAVLSWLWDGDDLEYVLLGGDDVPITALPTTEGAINPSTSKLEVHVDGRSVQISPEQLGVVPTQVNGGEITAGSATGLRSYSPANIVSFIDQHAASGGSSIPAKVAALYPTGETGNLPAGWFLAGLYGSSAIANVGDYAYIVKSVGTVADVSFSLPSGEVEGGSPLTLSTETSGALIRYTDNGSTPTRSVGSLYTGTIIVNSSSNYKAIAYQDYWIDSNVSSISYTTPSDPLAYFEDNFNRTVLVSGAYDYANGPGRFSDMTLDSSRIEGTANGLWNAAAVNTPSFGPDQSSTVLIYGSGPLGGPAVRMSTVTGNCYMASVFADTGIRVRRFIDSPNGSFTVYNIGLDIEVPALVNGDSITLQVVGTGATTGAATFYLYTNGVIRGTRVDTGVPLNSGHPGIVSYSNAARWDNFIGEEI